MPSPEIVVQHVVYDSIFTNHVMSAYLGPDQGESFECLVATDLSRMMNDHVIRLPQIKIGSPHPIWRMRKRIIEWVLLQLFSIQFRLFFIDFIGFCVGIRGAVNHYEGE